MSSIKFSVFYGSFGSVEAMWLVQSSVVFISFGSVEAR